MAKPKVKKVKHKTHKASTKRMKITGTGRVKRYRAGKAHRMYSFSGKRVRQLRRGATVHTTQEKTYRRMLGG